MIKKVYYFRHTPIDVDKRMYEMFSEKISKGLTVIADTNFSPERISCGYSPDSAFFSTIILDSLTNKDAFIEELFRNNEDTIYIFNGIGFGNRYFDLVKKNNVKSYGFIAERDCDITKNIKNLMKKCFPKLSYLKYRYMLAHSSFFLAMGKSGIDCYKRFGVKKEILFDYMYNDGNTYIIPKIKKQSGVKFIYVGRFYNAIKGTDTLIEAVKSVSGNYTLDFVGGYGPNRDQILNEIEKLSQCDYLGTWDNKELCKKLNDYDVIIVPSKKDGWNLHNNLSIMAGIGCITSNETGSEELIEYCGNGIVFPAGDVNKLREAMQYVVDNPNTITSWKEKTKAFYKSISPEAVSDYLLEIVNYTIEKSGEKPIEPWRK